MYSRNTLEVDVEIRAQVGLSHLSSGVCAWFKNSACRFSQTKYLIHNHACFLSSSQSQRSPRLILCLTLSRSESKTFIFSCSVRQLRTPFVVGAQVALLLSISIKRSLFYSWWHHILRARVEGFWTAGEEKKSDLFQGSTGRRKKNLLQASILSISPCTFSYLYYAVLQKCWIYVLFLFLNRVMHILHACLVPSEDGIIPCLCA